MTGPDTDLGRLERELCEAVEGEVYFDETRRGLYATDASIYQEFPVCVVLPKHDEDVRAAMDLAVRHGVSILPRGGGTSLAGQTVGASMVLDLSRHMDRILEVNAEERWVRVQPGVIRDNLNKHLADHGLHFAPDPATSSRANVGGMIGNNSAGMRSIVYGKTVDHLLETRVRLSDGTEMTCGTLTPTAWQAQEAGDGRAASVHRAFRTLIEANHSEITARYPKVMRRSCGYNLDEFIREDWNLSNVFTGSEGTLATTLEARLNLEPLPKHTALCVIHFKDLLEAVRAVHPIVELEPSAVELLDHTVVHGALTNLSVKPLCDFVEGKPNTLLIVEFFGNSREDARNKVDEMIVLLRDRGLGYAYPVRDDAAGMARIWKVRTNGLGLMLGMKGDKKPLAFIEDAAVPVPVLAEYIEQVLEICRGEQTDCAMYAHASVGLIHVRPLLDLREKADIRRMVNIAERTFELVRGYGGSWSGEHGDGRVRSPFLERYFGSQLYGAFREVKQLFDPAGLMNPGKIVDALPMDQGLRYGENYQSPDFVTNFQFEEGAFASAVEMCSGVGACRQTLIGTMCPSYRATRREEDSVRGRANALRLVMTGQLSEGKEGLEDARALEILDLCLSCKGCKSECPSNVDMARLKSEFLHRYHVRHGAPLRDRLIAASMGAARRAAGPLAPLINAVQASKPARALLQRAAGFDARRQLPPFARRSLSTWFKQRTPGTGTSRVILFADTYANYYEPEIGRAAVELLEACGYGVDLFDTGCCQRPRISHGFLDAARRDGETTLRALDDLIQQGQPVICLEPSCCSSLTDDLPALIKDHMLTERIREGVMLMDTFLARELKAGRIEATLRGPGRRIVIHGHCHQKALYGLDAMQAVYQSIPGQEVQVLDTGCCGMAGSFGYEKEHYDLSVQIAEGQLLPAVRDTDAEIVASGFSCRHQLKDLAGIKARHFIETLSVQPVE